MPEIQPSLRPSLLNAKFFDIRIKYELFARDQRDVQEISIALSPLPRNSLNKDMTFEQTRPNGRKIISLAHQLGTLAREVAGSLLRHFRRRARCSETTPPVDR